MVKALSSKKHYKTIQIKKDLIKYLGKKVFEIYMVKTGKLEFSKKRKTR